MKENVHLKIVQEMLGHSSITLTLALPDIESIENRKKIFGAKIRLKAFKMKTFNGIPGHKQGQIELEFGRKEKELAQDFSKLMSHKLKMLSV